ncbi:methlytransferase [[Clostridium] sordellii]|uniref:methyltransferase domain-containing protein n=1 Tax=Paraclostridium sordellii TaxID=1505 RepID=UPI000542E84F|nr:methyltransferase domain-containing protein [Paeniclostridium sordellii]MBX9179341.1 methyltransferase domain-containing protein [Paeniclostridium sordellii]CEK33551.1 methlytransferase,Cyclopropane-fatty-acyl-phospholipid synthase,cyclopropane fatty acyl phospholipid synthase,Predicted methyltransferase (contains TPR repeat),magnesium protoporphyrin O-methyltransferase,Methyltransferase domain [[Clostridium] sordellii] [Paeniclostridium sordellii]CEN86742.1 methlytransferase [[Clostridium] s
MNQVEFFNKIAKEWDSIIEVNEEKINLLLSKLDIKSNERILDVGTGTGVIIPFIKALNKGGYIKGVDISTGMLNIAKEKYKNLENIEFEIKDVEEEEIYEKYDKIILYSMFPHLENKTKTVKTLINKNLNKNGKLIIAHSNSREFLNNMHKEKDKSVSKARLIPVNNQKKIFEKNGLKVLEAFENDQIYYLVLVKN